MARGYYGGRQASLARVGQLLLTDAGYSVHAFTNPQGGLGSIPAEPDAYDLLVTDQTMPSCWPGIRRRALHRRPGLPIVRVRPQRRLNQHGWGSGHAQFLAKPYFGPQPA